MFESENKKESDSIGELKRRLYTRGDMGRRSLRDSRLRAREENTPESWVKEKESDTKLMSRKPKTGMFKKLFVASFLFFLAAISYASYQFLGGNNVVSSKNINISVLGPAFISGGDEVSLQVSVENRNTVPLEFAELLVEYPKGAASGETGVAQEMVRNKISFKKIPAGGSYQEIVKATLYGEEGKEQTINFTLEYRVEGSNAIFKKENTYPIRISSSPISLSLLSPKETNAGQELSFKIKVASNAPKDVPGVLLQIDYPPGFFFKSAEPKPTYDNNVWKLGDFHTGSSREINVVGVLSGEDGDERTFRILGGGISPSNERTIGVIYNSIFQTVAIRRPFLDARVLLNGDSSDSVAIPGGRLVRGVLIWKNNLPTRINNAEISVKLSGNAFDRGTVSTERGFYNSSLSTISWDKNTVEDFQMVEPGGTGQLPFTFTPAQLFSSSGGILSLPQINLQIIVKGEVVSSSGDNSVSVTTEKIAKILTDLQVLSRALYSIGPFKNTGPVPPVAEKETTYTISWGVMNSASDVSGATVTTTLPPYVKWTGETSPESEDISYDEGSRTVTWRLNTVYASTGYRNSGREAFFQISFLPSLSHVGSSVGLTGGVSLAGTDSFANTAIQTTKNSLTTLLNNDPAFKVGGDIVVFPKP